jgi:hypothetical protein
MRLVVFGRSFALFSNADSGETVDTYSSIFTEQALLKQRGQRQSITSVGVKIGGKSLHQHLLPSGVSPQLKAVPQLEQFLTLIRFISGFLLFFIGHSNAHDDFISVTAKHSWAFHGVKITVVHFLRTKNKQEFFCNFLYLCGS